MSGGGPRLGGMESVIPVENLMKKFGPTTALARPPPSGCSPRCCARTPDRPACSVIALITGTTMQRARDRNPQVAGAEPFR